MNKNKIAIITLLIITILAIVLLLFKPNNKGIKKFYNSFGIELSKDTKVIYNESDFGWFGDGESLVIFEVSSKNMKEIIEKENLADWLRLPISKSIHDKLYGKIGLDSGEIRECLNLDRDKGFIL